MTTANKTTDKENQNNNGCYLSLLDISSEDANRLTYIVNTDNPKNILPEPEIVSSEVPKSQVLKAKTLTLVNEQKSYVPFTVERIKEVPVKVVVRRPVEVVQIIEKPIKKQIIKPNCIQTDEIIEIDVPYDIEERVPVPDYHDTSKQYCVAQTCIPVIKNKLHEQKGKTVYTPKVKLYDVYIPKVVNNSFEVISKKVSYKPVSELSKAQWNSIVLKLNPHLCEYGNIDHLPVHRNADGSVIAYKASEPVGVPI